MKLEELDLQVKAVKNTLEEYEELAIEIEKKRLAVESDSVMNKARQEQLDVLKKELDTYALKLKELSDWIDKQTELLKKREDKVRVLELEHNQTKEEPFSERLKEFNRREEEQVKREEELNKRDEEFVVKMEAVRQYEFEKQKQAANAEALALREKHIAEREEALNRRDQQSQI